MGPCSLHTLDYWASLSQSTYASYILKVIRKGSDITLIGWGAQLSVLKEVFRDGVFFFLG